MSIQQNKPVVPPVPTDRSLGNFTSIIQKNLADLHQAAHVHQVVSAPPSANDGSVGDIYIVSTTTRCFLTVKTANGWVGQDAGFITVSEFGADSSGKSDSSAAFIAAYSALTASGGGILFVPAGTYNVSKSLAPQSNTMIMGTGQRGTVINWTGSGFWLDNQTTGTIMTKFTIQGMTVNCLNGNSFCRIGTPDQAFSESNQHIDFWFKDLLVQSPAIVAGTYGLRLNTFIRTHIEDCVFIYFDIIWDLQKFDEAICFHNRLELAGTYGLYFHNDTGDIVADESTFVHLDIVGSSSMTSCAYLKEVENVRFFNTYLDASGGGLVPLGWKMNTVHNATIDGGTFNSETKLFDLTDVRNLTIARVGLQNPDQSPAPISSVTFTYNGNDLSGTGGPFADPNYGLIHVEHCAFLVANSFKGIPGVSVQSNGKYGAGDSHFGGMISDVSHLYSSQILDRNGTNGLLKETGMVLSPLSANTYLNGSSVAGLAIVTDANATTGYAIKVPTAASNIFLDLPYPGDALPGAYEIIARVRTSATATGSSLIVRYDSATKENYGGIDLTTSYKIITVRFNFSPSTSAPLSLRFTASSSADLFVDYIVVRPCANSVAFQTYVAPDITGVGTDTTPGFRHIYAAAAPTSGAWARGDIAWNTAPTSGGFAGWICTASGTPGTWKTFAAIS